MSNKLPTKRQLQQWLKEANAKNYKLDSALQVLQLHYRHLEDKNAKLAARLDRMMSIALQEDYQNRDICLQIRINPNLLKRSISPHAIIMDEVAAAIHQHHLIRR